MLWPEALQLSHCPHCTRQLSQGSALQTLGTASGVHSAWKDISGAGVASGPAVGGARVCCAGSSGSAAPRTPPRLQGVSTLADSAAPISINLWSLSEGATGVGPSVRVPRDCWGPSLGQSTRTCSHTWLGTALRDGWGEGTLAEGTQMPRARLLCGWLRGHCGGHCPGKAGSWPSASGAWSRGHGVSVFSRATSKRASTAASAKRRPLCSGPAFPGKPIHFELRCEGRLAL